MIESIDIGTISARGQVAIPTEIRDKMHLKQGEKVLFVLEGDALVMKKVSSMSWEEITKPIRKAVKKAGITPKDVQKAIKAVRARKKK